MTRINVGIEPGCLLDELLLAELREIKRLPWFKRNCKNQNSPTNFTLGKGHIKFFLPRLRYAKLRYERLKEEAEIRGFRVTDFSTNFSGIDLGEWWEPVENDREIIIERITERVKASRKRYWHYYGKRVTAEEVIKRIS